MSDLDKIVEELSSMSVEDAANLVSKLSDKWGIDPNAAAAPAAGAPAAGAPAAEEQTSFEVVLTAPGGNKINVIKEIRTITGLGLQESKALVDKCPSSLKTDVDKSAAEEMKTKLEAAGATVELK